MTPLLTLLGAALLFFTAHDIFATILRSHARNGPLSERLVRGVWALWRGIAFRLPRDGRHRFLNWIGPMLMPLLIVSFVALLMLGYALIYWPRMPEAFGFSAGAKSSPWLDALYFSGATLLTLGYGDIVPLTHFTRALALVESASGFALISLAVTYLLSVYAALEMKRAVALAFYHRAEEGADAAGFVAQHFVAGKFVGMEQALDTVTHDMQRLTESHYEHPIILYFHPIYVHKALPRVLFLTLEICTLVRTGLDAQRHAELALHPCARTLEATALYVLRQLTGSLKLPARSVGEPAEARRRREVRFAQSRARLMQAGIALAEESSALAGYLRERDAWEAQLASVAWYLGYDWEEVTGDRDLAAASIEPTEAAPESRPPE